MGWVKLDKWDEGLSRIRCVRHEVLDEEVEDGHRWLREMTVDSSE